MADERDKLTPDETHQPEIDITITPGPDIPGRGGPHGSSYQPQSGPMPRNLIEDDIAPARTPEMVCCDLGTRLRSFPGAPPTIGPDVYARVRQLTDIESPVYHEHDGWNEWVEIQMDGQLENFGTVSHDRPDNSTPLGFQAQVPEALAASLDAALIGSRQRHADDPSWRPADTLDPLGLTKANGSGRLVPNCLPLPFACFAPGTPHSGGIMVDVILTSTQDRTKVERMPLSEVARFLSANLGDTADTSGASARPLGHPAHTVANSRWEKRKPNAAKDALEHWNPVNVEGGEAQKSGVLKLKSVKFSQAHLRVESRLWYESFDTQDLVNYKCTRLPFSTADRVAFKLNTRQASRLYLKPRFLAHVPKRTWQQVGDVAYQTAYFDWAVSPERPFSKIAPRVGGLVFVSENGLFINAIPFYDSTFNIAYFGGVGGGYSVDVQQEFGTQWKATVKVTGGTSEIVTSLPFAAPVFGLGAPGDFGSEGCVIAAPGLRICAQVVDPTLPNSANGVSPLLYATSGLGGQQAQAFAFLLSPCLVGRMPIYNRPFKTIWQSAFDYMGRRPADAALLGTQVVMRYKESPFRAPNTDEAARADAFLKRRPSWNAREVVIDKPRTAFNQSSLAQLAGRAPLCSATMDDAVLYQALTFRGFGPLHDAGVPVMTTLRACLLGINGHQPTSGGSPLVWSQPFVSNDDYQTLSTAHTGAGFDVGAERLNTDLFPSRSMPGGGLCGIIYQNNVATYVWRMTAQDNYLPDAMRDQAFIAN